MQAALVLGSIHASVHVDALAGQRLVVTQPLGADHRSPDGPPLVALDPMGARQGDFVMLTSDGRFTREISGGKNSPARWSVAGIIDENSGVTPRPDSAGSKT